MARLVGGQVSVTGTAARLSTDSSIETSIILIKPLSGNSGDIYIGPSTVTTSNGYPLSPGEAYKQVFNARAGEAVVDLKPYDIYVVGTPGDTVAWQALRQ